MDKLTKDLYTNLPSDSGNLFFSPASVSIALDMLLQGSHGDTSNELIKLLYPDFGSLVIPTHLHVYRLMSWNASDVAGKFHLKCKNNLYVTGKMKNDVLRNSLETRYGVSIHQFDAKKIDEDFTSSTQGLLKPIKANPDFKFGLTNSIYLKAVWDKIFNAGDTHSGKFLVNYSQFGANEYRQVPVKYMTMEPTEFRVGRFPGFKILELPYQYKRFVVDIILPDNDIDIHRINLDILDERLKSLKLMTVHPTIPRFSFETNYSLISVLKHMGVERLFTKNIAELPGFETDLIQKFHIEECVHQARIDVTEESTEAISYSRSMGAQGSQGPIDTDTFMTFHADRSFMFLIRDLDDGSTMFAGRLIDPSKAS